MKLRANESVTFKASDMLCDEGKALNADLVLIDFYLVDEDTSRAWSGYWSYKIDDAKAEEIVASGDLRDEDNPFTDVPVSAYYHDAVLWALEAGVTTGTGATTFSPKDTCTRGQVATFLWRAMGKPEPTTTENPFKDVKESDYWYKPILWAYENGITTGTGKDTFSPDGTCTSAHVVTFLWRAMGKPEAAHSGTEYYAEAVAWATENGLLAGTDVAFAPDNLSPRADIVTYLYRFMNRS